MQAQALAIAHGGAHQAVWPAPSRRYLEPGGSLRFRLRLAGPNGAGNTTTVRLLLALIAPTGEIAIVVGHLVGSGNQVIRCSVGILTETPGLYGRLSAQQNLTFFARLYGSLHHNWKRRPSRRRK